MDTKSDEQFLVIESTIEANKQESDNKHKKTDDKLTLLTENQKETNEKLNETNEKLTLLLTSTNIDRTTFRNPLQTRRIHRLLRTLPPRSRLTGGLHHWKVETLPTLVACGPSNMRSSH